MQKRDPFPYSFWSYAWNVWFKKLRKLKLGSQQPCFLIPVLGCGDLGWDSNYGSQCGTHATSPIRVPPTLCRFLALSGPSLPLWDALGLDPLNPEKQVETIQPHGLKGLDFGKGKALNSLPVQGRVSHWVQILGHPFKSEKEKSPLILSQMACNRENRTSFLLSGHTSRGEPPLQGSYEPVLDCHIFCV